MDILVKYIAKVETDVQIKTSGMSNQWTWNEVLEFILTWKYKWHFAVFDG